MYYRIMKIKEITYSELKVYSYKVISIVEKTTGCENLSLSTKIETDLRITGDDIWDLLKELEYQFSINGKDFDFDQHFNSEGTNPILIPIIFLWITLVSLDLIIHSTYTLLKKRIHRNLPLMTEVQNQWFRNHKQDLSVADLVTWVIHKDFTLRKDIYYKMI